mmetsp:Transcript_46420/g.89512  ORF Transcript_46420/g.89512 Transcript_46420/m.89512 type:complete len:94 (-) Transcript_46420:337-618(-)
MHRCRAPSRLDQRTRRAGGCIVGTVRDAAGSCVLLTDCSVGAAPGQLQRSLRQLPRVYQAIQVVVLWDWPVLRRCAGPRSRRSVDGHYSSGQT